MMILKKQEFPNADLLVEFVVKNNIKQENIVNITSAASAAGSITHFIFFYGDSNVKELTRGWGGWS